MKINFSEWLDDEEEDPWTPEEIEADARAMNQRMHDYGIPDFDDEREGPDGDDDYITPDDIWLGQNRNHRVGHCIFTFTYSKRRIKPNQGDEAADWKEQGLHIVPCVQKHSEIERSIRLHPDDYKQDIVRGRYGNAWERPIITIWQGDEGLISDCLKELVRRDLAHPLARVYIDGENQGTIESLIDYQAHRPQVKKQPAVPVQVGDQTMDLSQIPGMLHTTPKASPLFAALQDFICKNKNNPQYAHTLKHVSNRVQCYQQSPNFANYQRLRSMLAPGQIDNNFRTQRDRDRAFDLMMKNSQSDSRS